ncbi:MAG: hypothetical protein OHK0022_08700 [Roseiflexaceae bacterium]
MRPDITVDTPAPRGPQVDVSTPTRPDIDVGSNPAPRANVDEPSTPSAPRTNVDEPDVTPAPRTNVDEPSSAPAPRTNVDEPEVTPAPRNTAPNETTAAPRGATPDEPNTAPRSTAGDETTASAPRSNTAGEAAGGNGSRNQPKETADGKATHHDEPEIEPGVVAKEPTDNGHTIKVRSDGDIVECSTCSIIRNKYDRALQNDPDLEAELRAVEARHDGPGKARAAMQLQNRLSADELVQNYDKAQLEAYIKTINESGDRLTPARVQELQDLASQVADDLNSGGLSPATRQRVETLLQDVSPLGFRENPIVDKAWETTMARMADHENYRHLFNDQGEIRPEFRDSPELIDLYNDAQGVFKNRVIPDLSRQLSAKAQTTSFAVPADVEFHHLLLKSLFPEHAVNPRNLILALRGAGYSDPQLHDCMHWICAGNGKMDFTQQAAEIAVMIRDVITRIP